MLHCIAPQMAITPILPLTPLALRAPPTLATALTPLTPLTPATPTTPITPCPPPPISRSCSQQNLDTDSGKSSCSPALLDCSFDSGICVDANDMQLQHKLKDYKRILLALERDREVYRLLRERLSKIVNKKSKKIENESEIICNVCCAEIDTANDKSFVRCSICNKSVCRDTKCSDWLPDSAQWECHTCHSSKESLAHTSSWVAEQISFNQHKFVYPMRARSEIYIPISEHNDSSMHFESVSQVGASASTADINDAAGTTISNEQKLKIREYVEEVVASMLGGTLDSVAVGQLSKSESYLPALLNGHPTHGNGSINQSNAHNNNSLTDLSQTRLRQLIETIIAETLRIPLGLSSSAVSEVAFNAHNNGGNALMLANGDARRHRTEHYFEPKIYQELLATAVLNKIADTHGNARHLSESSPDFTATDANQNFKEHQSSSSGSSIEPRSDCSFTDTDQILNLSKGEDFSPCGSNPNLNANVMSKLQLDAGRESALSDYIAAHMVPLPDLSAPVTESEEDDYVSITSSQLGDGNWEDNWLFKKKKSTLQSNATAGTIGMLVPAPKEDVRAQIGDKLADDISDLSEMGSDTDDSSLDILRGQLDPLNNRLLNKHLIGGQNTKMVLDELIDRSSMISSTSPAENEPIYTETKNRHVVNTTTKTEAINSTVTKSLLQHSPPSTDTMTEHCDSAIILPPPCHFVDTTSAAATLPNEAASPVAAPLNIIEDLPSSEDCIGFSTDVEIFDTYPSEKAAEHYSGARIPSVVEILAAIALGPMLAVPASEQQTVLTPTEMASLKELSDLALAEIKARDPNLTQQILGVIHEEIVEEDITKITSEVIPHESSEAPSTSTDRQPEETSTRPKDLPKSIEASLTPKIVRREETVSEQEVVETEVTKEPEIDGIQLELQAISSEQVLSATSIAFEVEAVTELLQKPFLEEKQSETVPAADLEAVGEISEEIKIEITPTLTITSEELIVNPPVLETVYQTSVPPTVAAKLTTTNVFEPFVGAPPVTEASKPCLEETKTEILTAPVLEAESLTEDAAHQELVQLPKTTFEGTPVFVLEKTENTASAAKASNKNVVSPTVFGTDDPTLELPPVVEKLTPVIVAEPVFQPLMTAETPTTDVKNSQTEIRPAPVLEQKEAFPTESKTEDTPSAAISAEHVVSPPPNLVLEETRTELLPVLELKAVKEIQTQSTTQASPKPAQTSEQVAEPPSILETIDPMSVLSTDIETSVPVNIEEKVTEMPNPIMDKTQTDFIQVPGLRPEEALSAESTISTTTSQATTLEQIIAPTPTLETTDPTLVLPTTFEAFSISERTKLNQEESKIKHTPISSEQVVIQSSSKPILEDTQSEILQALVLEPEEAILIESKTDSKLSSMMTSEQIVIAPPIANTVDLASVPLKAIEIPTLFTIEKQVAEALPSTENPKNVKEDTQSVIHTAQILKPELSIPKSTSEATLLTNTLEQVVLPTPIIEMVGQTAKLPTVVAEPAPPNIAEQMVEPPPGKDTPKPALEVTQTEILPTPVLDPVEAIPSEPTIIAVNSEEIILLHPFSETVDPTQVLSSKIEIPTQLNIVAVPIMKPPKAELEDMHTEVNLAPIFKPVEEIPTETLNVAGRAITSDQELLPLPVSATVTPTLVMSTDIETHTAENVVEQVVEAVLITKLSTLVQKDSFSENVSTLILEQAEEISTEPKTPASPSPLITLKQVVEAPPFLITVDPISEPSTAVDLPTPANVGDQVVEAIPVPPIDIEISTPIKVVEAPPIKEQPRSVMTNTQSEIISPPFLEPEIATPAVPTVLAYEYIAAPTKTLEARGQTIVLSTALEKQKPENGIEQVIEVVQVTEQLKPVLEDTQSKNISVFKPIKAIPTEQTNANKRSPAITSEKEAISVTETTLENVAAVPVMESPKPVPQGTQTETVSPPVLEHLKTVPAEIIIEVAPSASEISSEQAVVSSPSSESADRTSESSVVLEKQMPANDFYQVMENVSVLDPLKSVLNDTKSEITPSSISEAVQAISTEPTYIATSSAISSEQVFVPIKPEVEAISERSITLEQVAVITSSFKAGDPTSLLFAANETTPQVNVAESDPVTVQSDPVLEDTQTQKTDATVSELVETVPSEPTVEVTTPPAITSEQVFVPAHTFIMADPTSVSSSTIETQLKLNVVEQVFEADAETKPSEPVQKDIQSEITPALVLEPVEAISIEPIVDAKPSPAIILERVVAPTHPIETSDSFSVQSTANETHSKENVVADLVTKPSTPILGNIQPDLTPAPVFGPIGAMPIEPTVKEISPAPVVALEQVEVPSPLFKTANSTQSQVNVVEQFVEIDPVIEPLKPLVEDILLTHASEPVEAIPTNPTADATLSTVIASEQLDIPLPTLKTADHISPQCATFETQLPANGNQIVEADSVAKTSVHVPEMKQSKIKPAVFMEPVEAIQIEPLAEAKPSPAITLERVVTPSPNFEMADQTSAQSAAIETQSKGNIVEQLFEAHSVPKPSEPILENIQSEITPAPVLGPVETIPTEPSVKAIPSPAIILKQVVISPPTFEQADLTSVSSMDIGAQSEAYVVDQVVEANPVTKPSDHDLENIQSDLTPAPILEPVEGNPTEPTVKANPPPPGVALEQVHIPSPVFETENSPLKSSVAIETQSQVNVVDQLVGALVIESSKPLLDDILLTPISEPVEAIPTVEATQSTVITSEQVLVPSLTLETADSITLQAATIETQLQANANQIVEANPITKPSEPEPEDKKSDKATAAVLEPVEAIPIEPMAEATPSPEIASEQVVIPLPTFEMEDRTSIPSAAIATQLQVHDAEQLIDVDQDPKPSELVLKDIQSKMIPSPVLEPVEAVLPEPTVEVSPPSPITSEQVIISLPTFERADPNSVSSTANETQTEANVVDQVVETDPVSKPPEHVLENMQSDFTPTPVLEPLEMVQTEPTVKANPPSPGVALKQVDIPSPIFETENSPLKPSVAIETQSEVDVVDRLVGADLVIESSKPLLEDILLTLASEPEEAIPTSPTVDASLSTVITSEQLVIPSPTLETADQITLQSAIFETQLPANGFQIVEADPVAKSSVPKPENKQSEITPAVFLEPVEAILTEPTVGATLLSAIISEQVIISSPSFEQTDSTSEPSMAIEAQSEVIVVDQVIGAASVTKPSEHVLQNIQSDLTPEPILEPVEAIPTEPTVKTNPLAPEVTLKQVDIPSPVFETENSPLKPFGAIETQSEVDVVDQLVGADLVIESSKPFLEDILLALASEPVEAIPTNPTVDANLSTVITSEQLVIPSPTLETADQITLQSATFETQLPGNGFQIVEADPVAKSSVPKPENKQSEITPAVFLEPVEAIPIEPIAEATLSTAITSERVVIPSPNFEMTDQTSAPSAAIETQSKVNIVEQLFEADPVPKPSEPVLEDMQPEITPAPVLGPIEAIPKEPSVETIPSPAITLKKVVISSPIFKRADLTSVPSTAIEMQSEPNVVNQVVEAEPVTKPSEHVLENIQSDLTPEPILEPVEAIPTEPTVKTNPPAPEVALKQVDIPSPIFETENSPLKPFGAIETQSEVDVVDHLVGADPVIESSKQLLEDILLALASEPVEAIPTNPTVDATLSTVITSEQLVIPSPTLETADQITHQSTVFETQLPANGFQIVEADPVAKPSVPDPENKQSEITPAVFLEPVEAIPIEPIAEATPSPAITSERVVIPSPNFEMTDQTSAASAAIETQSKVNTVEQLFEADPVPKPSEPVLEDMQPEITPAPVLEPEEAIPTESSVEAKPSPAITLKQVVISSPTFERADLTLVPPSAITTQSEANVVDQVVKVTKLSEHALENIQSDLTPEPILEPVEAIPTEPTVKTNPPAPEVALKQVDIPSPVFETENTPLKPSGAIETQSQENVVDQLVGAPVIESSKPLLDDILLAPISEPVEAIPKVEATQSTVITSVQVLVPSLTLETADSITLQSAAFETQSQANGNQIIEANPVAKPSEPEPEDKQSDIATAAVLEPVEAIPIELMAEASPSPGIASDQVVVPSPTFEMADQTSIPSAFIEAQSQEHDAEQIFDADPVSKPAEPKPEDKQSDIATAAVSEPVEEILTELTVEATLPSAIISEQVIISSRTFEQTDPTSEPSMAIEAQSKVIVVDQVIEAALVTKPSEPFLENIQSDITPAPVLEPVEAIPTEPTVKAVSPAPDLASKQIDVSSPTFETADSTLKPYVAIRTQSQVNVIDQFLGDDPVIEPSKPLLKDILLALVPQPVEAIPTNPTVEATLSTVITSEQDVVPSFTLETADPITLHSATFETQLPAYGNATVEEPVTVDKQSEIAPAAILEPAEAIPTLPTVEATPSPAITSAQVAVPSLTFEMADPTSVPSAATDAQSKFNFDEQVFEPDPVTKHSKPVLEDIQTEITPAAVFEPLEAIQTVPTVKATTPPAIASEQVVVPSPTIKTADLTSVLSLATETQSKLNVFEQIFEAEPVSKTLEPVQEDTLSDTTPTAVLEPVKVIPNEPTVKTTPSPAIALEQVVMSSSTFETADPTSVPSAAFETQSKLNIVEQVVEADPFMEPLKSVLENIQSELTSAPILEPVKAIPMELTVKVITPSLGVGSEQVDVPSPTFETVDSSLKQSLALQTQSEVNFDQFVGADLVMTLTEPLIEGTIFTPALETIPTKPTEEASQLTAIASEQVVVASNQVVVASDPTTLSMESIQVKPTVKATPSLAITLEQIVIPPTTFEITDLTSMASAAIESQSSEPVLEKLRSDVTPAPIFEPVEVIPTEPRDETTPSLAITSQQVVILLPTMDPTSEQSAAIDTQSPVNTVGQINETDSVTERSECVLKETQSSITPALVLDPVITSTEPTVQATPSPAKTLKLVVVPAPTLETADATTLQSAAIETQSVVYDDNHIVEADSVTKPLDALRKNTVSENSIELTVEDTPSSVKTLIEVVPSPFLKTTHPTSLQSAATETQTPLNVVCRVVELDPVMKPSGSHLEDRQSEVPSTPVLEPVEAIPTEPIVDQFFEPDPVIKPSEPHLEDTQSEIPPAPVLESTAVTPTEPSLEATLPTAKTTEQEVAPLLTFEKSNPTSGPLTAIDTTIPVNVVVHVVECVPLTEPFVPGLENIHSEIVPAAVLDSVEGNSTKPTLLAKPSPAITLEQVVVTSPKLDKAAPVPTEAIGIHSQVNVVNQVFVAIPVTQPPMPIVKDKQSGIRPAPVLDPIKPIDTEFTIKASPPTQIVVPLSGLDKADPTFSIPSNIEIHEPPKVALQVNQSDIVTAVILEPVEVIPTKPIIEATSSSDISSGQVYVPPTVSETLDSAPDLSPHAEIPTPVNLEAVPVIESPKPVLADTLSEMKSAPILEQVPAIEATTSPAVPSLVSETVDQTLVLSSDFQIPTVINVEVVPIMEPLNPVPEVIQSKIKPASVMDPIEAFPTESITEASSSPAVASEQVLVALTVSEIIDPASVLSSHIETTTPVNVTILFTEPHKTIIEDIQPELIPVPALERVEATSTEPTIKTTPSPEITFEKVVIQSPSTETVCQTRALKDETVSVTEQTQFVTEGKHSEIKPVPVSESIEAVLAESTIEQVVFPATFSEPVDPSPALSSATKTITTANVVENVFKAVLVTEPSRLVLEDTKSEIISLSVLGAMKNIPSESKMEITQSPAIFSENVAAPTILKSVIPTQAQSSAIEIPKNINVETAPAMEPPKPMLENTLSEIVPTSVSEPVEAIPLISSTKSPTELALKPVEAIQTETIIKANDAQQVFEMVLVAKPTKPDLQDTQSECMAAPVLESVKAINKESTIEATLSPTISSAQVFVPVSELITPPVLEPLEAIRTVQIIETTPSQAISSEQDIVPPEVLETYSQTLALSSEIELPSLVNVKDISASGPLKSILSDPAICETVEAISTESTIEVKPPLAIIAEQVVAPTNSEEVDPTSQLTATFEMQKPVNVFIQVVKAVSVTEPSEPVLKGTQSEIATVSEPAEIVPTASTTEVVPLQAIALGKIYVSLPVLGTVCPISEEPKDVEALPVLKPVEEKLPDNAPGSTALPVSETVDPSSILSTAAEIPALNNVADQVDENLSESKVLTASGVGTVAVIPLGSTTDASPTPTISLEPVLNTVKPTSVSFTASENPAELKIANQVTGELPFMELPIPVLKNEQSQVIPLPISVPVDHSMPAIPSEQVFAQTSVLDSVPPISLNVEIPFKEAIIEVSTTVSSTKSSISFKEGAQSEVLKDVLPPVVSELQIPTSKLNKNEPIQLTDLEPYAPIGSQSTAEDISILETIIGLLVVPTQEPTGTFSQEPFLEKDNNGSAIEDSLPLQADPPSKVLITPSEPLTSAEVEPIGNTSRRGLIRQKNVTDMTPSDEAQPKSVSLLATICKCYIKDKRLVAALEKRRSQTLLIQRYLNSFDIPESQDNTFESVLPEQTFILSSTPELSTIENEPEKFVVGDLNHFTFNFINNILFSDQLSSDSNDTNESALTTVEDMADESDLQLPNAPSQWDENSSSSITLAPEYITNNHCCPNNIHNTTITTNTNTSTTTTTNVLTNGSKAGTHKSAACSTKPHSTDEEEVDHVDNDLIVLRRFVPGSIAEREYKKWHNAVDMPNNPYAPEALKRRISGSQEKFIDLPNISPTTEQNPVSLLEGATKDDIEQCDQSQERDYKRYSRDYYINDIKSPITSSKPQTLSASMTTSQDSTDITINEAEIANMTASNTPSEHIYQALPAQVVEDPVSLETQSTLSNQSIQSVTTTASDDSDTIRIYDFKKQETTIIRDVTMPKINTAATQSTSVESNRETLEHVVLERKERPTDLAITKSKSSDAVGAAAPFTPTRGSTPKAFKFLQPKLKLIDPSQVLSVDEDDVPTTPTERKPIEDEVAHALPSVKALAQAFLMTTRNCPQVHGSTRRWPVKLKKFSSEPVKSSPPTVPPKLLDASPSFADLAEDATIASDLSSLETDPSMQQDTKESIDAVDSTASGNTSPVPVRTGVLRSNIAFFENLKFK